jgi:hypothetical protein
MEAKTLHLYALLKKNKQGWTLYHVPIILATQKTEVGGSLEPRRLGPALINTVNPHLNKQITFKILSVFSECELIFINE